VRDPRIDNSCSAEPQQIDAFPAVDSRQVPVIHTHPSYPHIDDHYQQAQWSPPNVLIKSTVPTEDQFDEHCQSPVVPAHIEPKSPADVSETRYQQAIPPNIEEIDTFERSSRPTVPIFLVWCPTTREYTCRPSAEPSIESTNLESDHVSSLAVDDLNHGGLNKFLSPFKDFNSSSEDGDPINWYLTMWSDLESPEPLVNDTISPPHPSFASCPGPTALDASKVLRPAINLGSRLVPCLPTIPSSIPRSAPDLATFSTSFGPPADDPKSFDHLAVDSSIESISVSLQQIVAVQLLVTSRCPPRINRGRLFIRVSTSTLCLHCLQQFHPWNP